jgi:hypothetical protein
MKRGSDRLKFRKKERKKVGGEKKTRKGFGEKD